MLSLKVSKFCHNGFFRDFDGGHTNEKIQEVLSLNDDGIRRDFGCAETHGDIFRIRDYRNCIDKF